MSAFIIFSNL